MCRTKIVANAVCDLTPEQAEKYGVILIPEIIVFDGIPNYSNLDFNAEELYRRMRESKELPTGAHPNVGMYIEAFRTAGEDGDDIVCLNMTSRMSGSFNTANIAKGELEEEGFPHRIYICDTLELTHGLGFLVVEAAKMANEGKSGEMIMNRLEGIKGKIGIYFVLKSLENARKGGRLGAIKTRVAESLNIKPVLMFRDGIETDVKVVYSFGQALKCLSVFYNKQAKKGGHVVIFHADNLKDAEYVRDQVIKLDSRAQIDIEWLGSAIGIYTGEGCVGITFWEP